MHADVQKVWHAQKVGHNASRQAQAGTCVDFLFQLFSKYLTSYIPPHFAVFYERPTPQSQDSEYTETEGSENEDK